MSAHMDATERLRRSARRVLCHLTPPQTRAVAAHAALWRRRGLPRSALSIVETCALAGLGACIVSGDVAALTLCGRCGGDGEWSPPPHVTYPELCPDCGGTGWAEAPDH